MRIGISITRNTLSWNVISITICGDNFCFKGQGLDHVGTFRQFLLSHIGKKASLFALYKAWTNGWRVPLVWYSSVSSSASDITIASTPCVSSSNWNLSISSLSEEKDAIPSWVVRSPKLDGQLEVVRRRSQKSGISTDNWVRVRWLN